MVIISDYLINHFQLSPILFTGIHNCSSLTMAFTFCMVVRAGQICDVMMSDTLLTLCGPSVSSADTNTSNLFQLRPALLSKTIVTMVSQHACHLTSERMYTNVCVCLCACVFRLGFVIVLRSVLPQSTVCSRSTYASRTLAYC